MKPINHLGLAALALVAGLAQATDKDDAMLAGYACQQQAIRAVKTLGKVGSAAQPANRSDDSRWRDRAGVWVASGDLSYQQRFGAEPVRLSYRCTVQKTPAGGWTLLELHWPQGAP